MMTRSVRFHTQTFRIVSRLFAATWLSLYIAVYIFTNATRNKKRSRIARWPTTALDRWNRLAFTRSDSNERRSRGDTRAAETRMADRRRSSPSSRPSRRTWKIKTKQKKHRVRGVLGFSNEKELQVPFFLLVEGRRERTYNSSGQLSG